MKLRTFRTFVCLTLVILLAFLLLCIRMVKAASAMKTASGVVFVIDPGHGGEDGGAVGKDGLRESDVNLAVSLRLDALLGLCGAETRLTRTGDGIVYPADANTTRKRKRADQQQRVALLASTEGAVLVSIHQNKYPSVSPHGAQVFYGSVEGSQAFAEHVQAALAALGSGNRSAAAISDSIYLMREACCPAILVECGFLSNPQELALLRTEQYQTKLAVCLAAACVGHQDELENHYGKG